MLRWWLLRPTDIELGLRVPQPREAIRKGQGQETVVTRIEGTFRRYDGQPGPGRGAWPAFRGEGRDNICRDDTELAERWPDRGPRRIWSVELGEGHAGPAVRDGRVFVLDYDEEARADALRCFSMEDGQELWRRWYKVRIKRNHGISRTVPAVSADAVVSLGPKCHVMCCDAATGAFRWGIDLVREFAADVPLWYTGQCPLIDDGIAVVAPGGNALMIGVACDTGEVVWKTPNPEAWAMSHASVVVMTLCGRRMHVYPAIGGVVGVAADGPDRGAILWKTSAWDHAVVVPSPVAVGENRVFLTAGYGAGSMVLQISRQGAAYEAVPILELDRKIFACEQQTPVFVRGHLFTVLPNDAGPYRKQLACMRPDGEVIWRSGKKERFGLGPFLVADGKLLVLDDEGVLTMAKASAAGYVRLAHAKVVNGRDPWGPMAMVAGRLLLRDSRLMVCLDLAVQPGTDASGAP